MIGQDPRTDAIEDPRRHMFRAYSAERRDRAPLIETEDFRDEGARRFWDDCSPPYFGFKKGSEGHVQLELRNLCVGCSQAGIGRIGAIAFRTTDPAHSKWSGYASIYFSDSNADGRQQSSEVAQSQRQRSTRCGCPRKFISPTA